MIANMPLKSRLASAFSILIFILILMTGFAATQMQSLSNFTQLLYKHPFSVSIAVVKIEEAVTSIHRSMKDIALANSIQQINDAAAKVDVIEKQTFQYFDVLNERFLGDKSEIKVIKENFINWSPIRNKVIELMKEGKRTEAAKITKEKGTKHIQDLNIRLSKLEEFATNKANEFTKNSLKQGESALLNLIVLVSIGIILAIVLSWRITLSILRPVGGEPKDIEVLTHKVAEGDLSIKFKDSGKETGIYLAMRLMVEKLKLMIEQLQSRLQLQSIKCMPHQRRWQKIQVLPQMLPKQLVC